MPYNFDPLVTLGIANPAGGSSYCFSVQADKDQLWQCPQGLAVKFSGAEPHFFTGRAAVDALESFVASHSAKRPLIVLFGDLATAEDDQTTGAYVYPAGQWPTISLRIKGGAELPEWPQLT